MNGFEREMTIVFDRARARNELSYLKLLRMMGREPPIVRWMPRRRWFA